MMDDIDRMMAVMESAFDPAFGEAWNRRQLSDALVRPACRYLLAGPDGVDPATGAPAAGFALARRAADEEELLLIAVSPEWRGRGIGEHLLQRVVVSAQKSGVDRIFLEMRDGNPAETLYRRCGFIEVGRRKNYYRRGAGAPIDAITFSWQSQFGKHG